MKIVIVTMMALMTGAAAQAGETRHSAERTVTVCVEGVAPKTLLPIAKGIASKMFAGIGVTIYWRQGLGDCLAQGIVVELTDNTPASLVPGALAYAAPYEGTHIRVFCDRILERHEPLLEAHLLAHVLAHEITHLLQGICRHSDRGVMKAKWGLSDFSQMMLKSLPFTEDDIKLIYDGIVGRGAPPTASPRLLANPEFTGGYGAIVGTIRKKVHTDVEFDPERWRQIEELYNRAREWSQSFLRAPISRLGGKSQSGSPRTWTARFSINQRPAAGGTHSHGGPQTSSPSE